MKPLSLKKRTLLLGILTVLGMTMVPFLLLYANGYRMSKDNVVVETGGLFVRAPLSHGTLSVDGTPASELSLFNHDVFVQSLIPKTYLLTYAREGYSSWQKTIFVENQRVTDVAPFIVPLDPTVTTIAKTLTETSTINPEYTKAVSLFKSEPVMSNEVLPLAEGFFAVPTPYIIDHTIALARRDGALVAYWTSTFNLIPQMFCKRVHHMCSSEITLLEDATSVSQFLFYPGRNDVVLLVRADGIYIREIDPRGHINEVLFYRGDGLEIRTVNESLLYIKDGSLYKKIELI